MTDRVPSNWPAHLKYLTKLELSKAIDKPTRDLLAPKGVFSRTCSSHTKIRRIEDPAHPACGQNGLFAAKDLRSGDHIVDYMGHIHLPVPEDSNASSDYDLSLRHGDLYLGVDADKMGNESRMVNDYRGIKSAPNARFDTYVTSQYKEVRMGIFVIGKGKRTSRGIKKGEEILVSYGKGFWRSRVSQS